ncbi:MAG: 16S rRNA (uracil(1498)-N(3))-methyltransferase [Polyangiaceae bacterium UTPRO1]|jgi:RsmE family RNA methyltransferase|nr:16S rRNA (uracil(1498)-N(3))-methyltransferase [Myxococcales bacterium]OQY67588.1 MAG: 16S rRNA (uracil(1498)-N(3))-methyltransferase [Polyangiaceae bacterium UTPRO1]
MNTLLLAPSELAAAADGVVRLAADRRLRHVRAVHRAAAGTVLRVGVLGGRLGRATVVRIDDTGLDLAVVLDREPPPPAPLTLVLALPRPKVVRRVFQAVAALGVKRLCLVAAWRVEKSYWESPLLAAAAVTAELVLGLEQAGDTVLPAVTLHRRFKPFVEDELPAIVAGTRGFVAHPPAAGRCPCDLAAPATLAIGPEGGFIGYEVDALERQGLAAVSLGPRVLRVEQALPALVARLCGP